MEYKNIKAILTSATGFTDDTKRTDRNTFGIGSLDQISDNRNSKGWLRAEYILLRDDNIADQEELRNKWRSLGWVRTEYGKDVAPYAPQFLIFRSAEEWHIWNCFGEEIGTAEELKRIIGLDKFRATGSLPRQIVYYGAPGTGKSNKIDEMTNEENRIRTTFHPDSDYSTFVGAYKPFQTSRPLYGLNQKETVRLKDEQGNALSENIITYKFVPQAFLKAYVEAWTRWNDGNDAPYYLVIEEINRGNCAQIFGDIFQLLDRDSDGKSRYAIRPDEDIRNFLAEQFEECANLDAKIKSGEMMMLPSNLYIWATMNTSDQSLFPIDSAFKRRWDWRYMKIRDAKKGWKIDIETQDGEKQDWWTFLEQINKIIANMTSSEDKQLGYFFCKPTECNEITKPIGVINKNGQSKEVANSIGQKTPNMFVVEEVDTETEPTIISAETFVSKVVFYLWNDVFKDYGFEDNSLFKYTDNGMEQDLTFPAFYKDDEENSVDKDVVKQFIENVMAWKSEEKA